MRGSLLLLFVSFALPYGARADQPVAAEPAGIAAPPNATATSTSTADPPAVEKTPAELKKEAAEAKIRQFGINGYKPENTKNGDVVYCKKEAPIGSRFETKQCRTFEQLRDEALRGKEYLEQMQHVVGPNKG